MSEKWFRMQDGPPLPWEVGIAIYRGLYEKLFSHQSAETVHARGGGGYDEIKAMAKQYHKMELDREAALAGAEKRSGQ